MSRSIVLSSAILFAIVSGVHAEAPRFQFRQGETLAYHLVQTTRIVETVADEKTGKPGETESTT